MSGAEAVAGADFVNRKLPPVAEIAVVSMALVIIGGIFMAAHLPAHPPLGFAEVLLVLAGVVLVTNVVLLARLQDFAWASFFLVAKWSLLAYLVIAGILEYIFVFDGTRGQIPGCDDLHAGRFRCQRADAACIFGGALPAGALNSSAQVVSSS